MDRTEREQFSRDVSREGLRKGYRGAVGREILLLLSLLTVSHALVRSGRGDASGVLARDVGAKSSRHDAAPSLEVCMYKDAEGTNTLTLTIFIVCAQVEWTARISHPKAARADA